MGLADCLSSYWFLCAHVYMRASNIALSASLACCTVVKWINFCMQISEKLNADDVPCSLITGKLSDIAPSTS